MAVFMRSGVAVVIEPVVSNTTCMYVQCGVMCWASECKGYGVLKL